MNTIPIHRRYQLIGDGGMTGTEGWTHAQDGVCLLLLFIIISFLFFFFFFFSFLFMDIFIRATDDYNHDKCKRLSYLHLLT
jgi:hypothetical protein